MHGNPRRDFARAVVKGGAAGEHFAHHRNDVLNLERRTHCLVAHAAAGGVGHLAVLQVIARLRKQIVIAAMVVMQVTDDDALYRLSDTERCEPIAHRLDHLALTFLAHRLVEASVDNNCARRADDRPDKKIERLQNVVWIAVNEISRRPARMVAIANGVTVNIVRP